MKSCFLLFFATALVAAPDSYPVSPAAEAVPHPAADASGFVSLFNGRDLAGWKTKGNWVYDTDGTVTLKPRAGETGWKRFDAYIFTERKYRDFVLAQNPPPMLQHKIPKRLCRSGMIASV